jgi:glycine/D-amino acid oxidase-like deaminating enzyme
MTVFDAAVVGAGIVGAACAASLSAAGLTVIIIDHFPPASGTTGAGMGHIVVMDDSDAQFQLTSYSQKLWNELASELPASAEFENCGTIWVAGTDLEMDQVRLKKDFYDARGVPAEILSETDLINAEPNLRKGMPGGLLVPGDSVVYQPVVASYLIEKARQRGAVVRTGERAVEIQNTGVRLASGEAITAGKVINAAGAQAVGFSPSLNIRRRKGHLVISERFPGFAHHQLIELGYLMSAHGSDEDSVAFNIQPRSTGQVLLGSSRQYDDSTDIDHDILRRMTARAFEYMPKLKHISAVRVWTGHRPSTPDNLPYIGPDPDSENVYVAAGHEGLGITTSLGTAELITDMIVGRRSVISATPYLPTRDTGGH